MHITAGQHAEGELATRGIALCPVRRNRRRQSMTQRNRNVSSNDSHNQPGDVEEFFEHLTTGRMTALASVILR